MSEQVLIQFRADKELKQEVADIYEQLGMDLPTALRMFLKKSKQRRGLPFSAVLPDYPEEINAEKMTGEELYNKLRKGYKEIEEGKYVDAKEFFSLKRKVGDENVHCKNC